MFESKSILTNRLTREGRWEEASLYKDGLITKLRSEGKPRKEAQSMAWEQIETKYPPLAATSQTEEDEGPPDAWADHWDSANGDYIRDVQWVYGRIACSQVQPADAPSSGAWAMLRWARRNEDRFFETTLPKITAKSPKPISTMSDELSEEYKMDMTEIRAMLFDHHLDQERKAVADTAKAVKEKVASNVSDWQRQYSLDLPSDACESWALQMTSLADDLIRAALKHPEEYRTCRKEKHCE